jgi:glycosyltransferase involved in cell wall biosynthesis
MTNNPKCWCFITPEYPPTVGGVGDYTRLVAMNLANNGQEVIVLAPFGEVPLQKDNIKIKTVLGKFGPIGFWRGSCILDCVPKPSRLFLQWVPHGFGFKSMNLLLIVWIWWRVVVRQDRLWVMVHEPFFRFENSLKQVLAAFVHRLMVWVLLRCAERVFAANRLWIDLVSYYAPKKLLIDWLPIPSNIPVESDPVRKSLIKKKYADGKMLVGNFGTFGLNTSVLLGSEIKKVLISNSNINILFIGKNSEIFLDYFLRENHGFKNCVFATGELSTCELSYHLSACDFFIQLNQEGISARNGTLMAILSHGKTGVGNWGTVTDPEWANCDGFFVESLGEIESKVAFLANNPSECLRMGKVALDLYTKRFSLDEVGKKLLSP